MVPVVLLVGISVCDVHSNAFRDVDIRCSQRGMTMAPRIEVYTQIACDEIHPTVSPSLSNLTTIPVLPLTLRNFQLTSPAILGSSMPITSPHTFPLMYMRSNAGEKEFSATAPSEACLRDPAVQSRAAGIQASTWGHFCITNITYIPHIALATILGVLSIITAGYWGQISDAFGRKAAMSAVLFGMTFQCVFNFKSRMRNSS